VRAEKASKLKTNESRHKLLQRKNWKVLYFSDHTANLTCSLPVYKYIVPKNHTRAAIFAPITNSITRQSIVLKSCSNPQKTRLPVCFLIDYVIKGLINYFVVFRS